MVDVRVLSNVNVLPQQAIDENKLRRDLFYRLGVVNIAIPPLRERKEDIPLLAKQFIMKCNAKLSRNARDLDPATLDLFQAYDWPGNVRELEHAIEHAINVLPDDESLITPEYIPGVYAGCAADAQDKTGVCTDTAGGNIAEQHNERCRAQCGLQDSQGKRRKHLRIGARTQNEPPEPAVSHPKIRHQRKRTIISSKISVCWYTDGYFELFTEIMQKNQAGRRKGIWRVL